MKKTFLLLSLLTASFASAEIWSSTFDFTTANPGTAVDGDSNAVTVAGTNGVTATIDGMASNTPAPTFEEGSGWDITGTVRYDVSFGDNKLDVSGGNTLSITLTDVTFSTSQTNDWPVLFSIGDGTNQNVKVIYDKGVGALTIDGENQFSSSNNAYTIVGDSIDVTAGQTYSSLTFTATAGANGGYDFTLTLDGTTQYFSTSAEFSQNTDNLQFCVGGRLDSANNNSTMTIGGMTVAVTPEPTTATLSLLALAGLCVRRRRK